MSKIIYANHVKESHLAIAEDIRSSRPLLYFMEIPDTFTNALQNFAAGKINLAELKREGVNFPDNGTNEILFALRDVGAKILPTESQSIVDQYRVYQRDELLPAEYGLNFAVQEYEHAKRTKKLGFDPVEKMLRELTGEEPLIFQAPPDVVIARYEIEKKQFLEKIKIFTKLELERDIHIAKTILLSSGPSSIGYFGYLHRNVSNMLQRKGIYMPAEYVGEIAIPPQDKLMLLLKYQWLGLDPAELRHPSIPRDVDEKQMDRYLDLTPYFVAFREANRGPRNVTLFWENLDKIQLD